MTISVNQRTYVGIASLQLKRKSDGVVLNWPQPQTFVLNTNIEQRIQEGRNAQGRKVRTGSYNAGEMPDLTIAYTYVQPEMISFNLGNQFASGTFDQFLPRTLEVTKNTYAGGAIGSIYNGITADDATAAASVTRDGISTALTRVADATFDPVTDDTWALGADGALQFADNLVAAQEVVTLLLPNSVTGIKLSDVLVGPHELYAFLVDTRNKITIFSATNVSPNLEGRSVDFGSEGMEISLFLNNPPGACRAFDVLATELSVECL